MGVGWGSVVQVPAFRAVDGFEVAALCARRSESVEAAGQRLGVDDLSVDWEDFVRRDDLDLISVCTPVDLHREQTLAAIAAGKHVLVEKPVGLDSTQTGEMLAAAEAVGVCHAVCFENRWDPVRLRLWEMVGAGHVGDPYLVLARTGADFWHPTRGLQSEWMYRADRGGGYLMGMASHDIDFLCALFGEPESVCADIRVSVPERVRDDGSVLAVDADDTASLLIRMANGASATIVTTAVALQQDFKSFEVFGSAGSLAIDGRLMGEDATTLEVGTAGREGRSDEPASDRQLASGAELPKRRASAAIKSLALMLEDWLPAFDGQPSRAPTLVDGHRVQRIIDAARRSSAGDGWVAP